MYHSTLKIRVRDIFGIMYSDFLSKKHNASYIIRREDGFATKDNLVSRYFQGYNKWSNVSKAVLRAVKGRILDLGAGAGRHALHYQKEGFEVYAVDDSPLAVEVMKKRGISNVLVGDITRLAELNFQEGFFNTVLLMFNNFGLGGDTPTIIEYLREFYRITNNKAKIITVGINPDISNEPDHVEYNRSLMQRDCSGSIKLRVEYKGMIGMWYTLYMISPKKMAEIILRAGWKVERFVRPESSKYGAIIIKK